MTDALEIDDLDDRQLCPDGNCVGVIGEDGRCRVCGTAGDTSLAVAKTAAVHASDGEPLTATAAVDLDAPVPDADWHDRQLCPDGTCIGVLSAEGVCTTCGQRAR